MTAPTVPRSDAGAKYGNLSGSIAARNLQGRAFMRDPRYRFSDDVRSVTRAIALRMIHAGDVAATSESLGAWIARTDDLRERLKKGGYGSEFTAADLFPLFQGFVAKATAATATATTPPARSLKWVWIGAIVVVIVAVVAAVVLTL